MTSQAMVKLAGLASVLISMASPCIAMDPRCNGPARYDAMRDADHSGFGTGNACSPPPVEPRKRFSVHRAHNGWWAHIEGHAYPFGAWRMDRGPYPFRWMAEMEFPIERLTKDGPRR